jgi:hypothetical protein
MSLWLSVSRTRLLWLTWAFYAVCSYSLRRLASTGWRLTSTLRNEATGGIGYGRLELTAAMRSSAVAVGLALDQCAPQMAFVEDQRPVGDLGPGREHNRSA